MENDIKLMREKLNNSFTKVFEKGLLDEIIMIANYRKFESGDILIDIGDKMTHIPLIINGVVKIIREDKNEDEILLYFLEKGDTCAISFVNCINQSQSMFRGIVEKDVECIMLPVHKIEDWIIKYKTWRHFIIDSYHNRLIEMVEAIDSLAFLKLDNRLYKYLSDKMRIVHSGDLTITHQEIADDLNTSRVVISRLLKALERKGKIKLGRNKINMTV